MSPLPFPSITSGTLLWFRLVCATTSASSSSFFSSFMTSFLKAALSQDTSLILLTERSTDCVSIEKALKSTYTYPIFYCENRSLGLSLEV
jgi:hypothetical protein